MVEEGYCFPLTLAVASDSHSNTYGGMGALGTPVVRTDAAAIWATGQTWWQVPPVARVLLKGSLPRHVSGKDVIVALCGLFSNDQVLNHAVEFVPESSHTLQSLPIDARLTISNMTTEWGALSGLFPVDQITVDWYHDRLKQLDDKHQLRPSNRHPRINHDTVSLLQSQLDDGSILRPDNDAHYAKTLTIDLSTIKDHWVAGPNSVKVANPVTTLAEQNIKIDKAYLVSCTNARLSDLNAAAAVLCPDGKHLHKVSPHVEFFFAAASSIVERMAKENGTWQILENAGCKPLPSGCGPCIGLGMGLLEDGQVGISATNRNFKGRMGSRNALAYLASPAVVAASAVMGRIASPDELLGNNLTIEQDNLPSVSDTIADQVQNSSTHGTLSNNVEIVPGFPTKISGELVFCDADNVNTDGIYPGKYTYKDDVPRDIMARVCMENYDPEFRNIVKEGDIVISGFNFGTGSSREQAATALLAKGVPLVVSGSFGNIFFRNSINNALLTLEVPALVQKLRSRYATHEHLPTRRTGWFLTWDISKAHCKVTEGDLNGPIVFEQAVPKLGANMQDIIVQGGLEKWVQAKIQSSN